MKRILLLFLAGFSTPLMQAMAPAEGKTNTLKYQPKSLKTQVCLALSRQNQDISKLPLDLTQRLQAFKKHTILDSYALLCAAAENDDVVLAQENIEDFCRKYKNNFLHVVNVFRTAAEHGSISILNLLCEHNLHTTLVYDPIKYPEFVHIRFSYEVLDACFEYATMVGNRESLQWFLTHYLGYISQTRGTNTIKTLETALYNALNMGHLECADMLNNFITKTWTRNPPASYCYGDNYDKIKDFSSQAIEWLCKNCVIKNRFMEPIIEACQACNDCTLTMLQQILTIEMLKKWHVSWEPEKKENEYIKDTIHEIMTVLIKPKKGTIANHFDPYTMRSKCVSYILTMAKDFLTQDEILNYYKQAVSHNQSIRPLWDHLSWQQKAKYLTLANADKLVMLAASLGTGGYTYWRYSQGKSIVPLSPLLLVGAAYLYISNLRSPPSLPPTI